MANFTDIYLLFTFGLSLRVNLESGLFSSLTILSDKIIFISTKWIFKFLSLLHYPPASLGRNGLEVSAAFLQPCVQPLHEPLFCMSPVGMSGTFLLSSSPACVFPGRAALVLRGDLWRLLGFLALGCLQLVKTPT